MMIYDTFAAHKPGTRRQTSTLEYLKKYKEHKSDRENKEPNKKNTADQFRSAWLAGAKRPDAAATQRYKEWKKLAVPTYANLKEMVAHIPGSWAIQFSFTLASPYLSKGIEAFDILDNPIVRDKVFEVPIVAASSWKGGLRAAAMTSLFGEDIQTYAQAVRQAQSLKAGQTQQWDVRIQQLVRMFGVESGIEHDYSAGRLHCFPTGFEQTQCEVINPHNRAHRVGTMPIFLECVPADQKGTFTMLYVPLGKVEPIDSAADLELCAQAVKALLTEWGIGAKKSSGNGLAKDALQEAAIFSRDQEAGLTTIDTFDKLIEEAHRVAETLKGQQ